MIAYEKVAEEKFEELAAPNPRIIPGEKDPMRSTYKAFKFLFMGPVILAFLFVINWMTSPGHWWVQWAALGIGIAWLSSLFQVIRAIVVAGGIAAFAAYLAQRKA